METRDAQRDGEGYITGGEKETESERERKRKRESALVEKREFHEMYPPMSGAARERPSDVRSITDELGVHAPKRQWRSSFFYALKSNSSFHKGLFRKCRK